MKRMIITAVMLLALIPAMLIGFAVNYYAKNTIKAEKLDALAGMAQMMDVHLSRYYDRIIYDVQKKAENETLKQVLEDTGESAELTPIERAAAEKVLLEYIGFQVNDGALIGSDGNTVLSSRSDEEGLMRNQTELFKTIIDGKDFYAGLVTVDTYTDIVEIAVPVRDDRGRIIGILKQNASLELLDDYLSSLELGETGQAFLIRKNGSMIYDNDQEQTAVLFHEYQNNNSLEQLVTDFKYGRLTEEEGIIEFQYKSREYIGAYDIVDSADCIAVVAVNRDEVLGDMAQVKGALSASGMFLLLLIAACAYIVGYLHVKPLNMINSTLKKIGNGDLTARCRYTGVLEFEELCRNINSMADSHQKNEKELRMSSRIDSLTYLPSRNAIYELLDTLLYKHPNQALLLLDLDGFTNVNYNLGYDIGDRILMETGDVLRDLPQHVCYPSRLGGSEFLVFITNWTSPKYPERIAKKIIRKIEGIRFIDENHVDISATIGIVYTDEERADKEKLIKLCNIAMHKSKLTGRSSYFVHYPYVQKDM